MSTWHAVRAAADGMGLLFRYAGCAASAARSEAMADVKRTLEAAYDAFNRRDIDGALAMMTEDVRWPKASEGGTVMGKDAIRAYWNRQWSEFDPRVEPRAIDMVDGGSVLVRVHQVVRDRAGNLLSDAEVVHVFSMRDGLIAAMELPGEDGNAGPAAAFAHPA